MSLFSKYCLFILITLCPQFLLGQENLLFSNDQYSGISAAMLSPTQTFLNPNPWDINLFTESIFFNTNYAYISQQSYVGLTKSEIKSLDIKNNVTGENTPSVLDFYNKDFGSYHFSSDFLGPSVNLKLQMRDKDFSVGFFSRLRTQSSAIEVDNYLRFSNQNILEPEIYLLKPFQINVMNWGEIGLNFSTEIFPYSNYQWILGANLKYEMGFDAVNVKNKSSLELIRTSEVIDGEDEKTITASNYNIEANYATSYNFETNRYEIKQQGKGLGFDIGIAFVDRFEDVEDYNLKMSINILDIGKINYTGENHIFEGNTIKVVNNPNLDNTKFDSPAQYLQLLSQEVYGDKSASLRGTDFTIGLPTSFHMNFSKNVGKNQFINADWVQRTPIFENSLKRSNIFQTSYSVQKPVLGYGASISLYEYRSLQFGGYLRFGPVILGSPNFLPFVIKQHRLHSGDFYIGIKLYPFWDSEMKRHRRANCNCN